MKYAIIENGVVVNTAIADAPITANWIQNDTAGIGCIYANGVLVEPVAPVPVVQPAPWTKKDFLLKFTTAEYAAIKAATLVNSTLDYYWQLFNVAGEIVKTDPVTIAGIQTLEAAGLLGAGRAAEILA